MLMCIEVFLFYSIITISQISIYNMGKMGRVQLIYVLSQSDYNVSSAKIGK